MKNICRSKQKQIIELKNLALAFFMLFFIAQNTTGQVTLEKEVKISDSVMFFDGNKVDLSTTTNNPDGYDYVYGQALTPHGDCIKSYKHFVYMTWYRGGKLDRHVMLTRYNMKTGVSKTIEFPHQHTGYNGKWWIGETHNTISVGICPKDSTIHMLYDLHRNGNITIDNIGTEDYLRYSYTETGGATVADEDFTLDRFVNSEAGNYKHLSFNGIDNVTVTKLLTYPDFFTNDEGDLFMKNRFGYSENGRFLFGRYDGEKWHGYTDFNRSNASNYGSEYNWGLYGEIKYLNGKIRVGFQRRSNNGTDKYLYQNGVYYAYSDDPAGLNQWKDYKGQEFARPLADADLIKIAEPGDWVETTQKDMVYIVSGFDFTITDAGDEHFVSQVKDNENNVTKKLHTYRKAGDAEFTTVEYSAGSELYASGNDVYVIGLSGGRVNIMKTEGGTNNFRQIYQHTTGPTFDKGVVNVEDGKLYYYLKESGGSGDKRTTYLQVFDLDIDTTPADTARVLNFKNLQDGQEIEMGANLTIEANVGSAFKEVALWSGDVNLGTLTNAPYTWSLHEILINMTEPSYTFKLVAKDSADVIVEDSITIYTPVIEVLSKKTSLHVSFEDEAIANWETDEADYGVIPAIIEGVKSRAGSKVIALDYSDGTSGHHVQNIVDKVVVPDQHYFHMIAYSATSDIAYGQTYPTAQLGDWKPTPSFTGHAENLVFERKVTSRQNTQGDSLNCYPRLRSKANGGACIVYYDDIVLYSDTNEEADLVSPTSIEDLTLSKTTDELVELNWTEGVDSLTGIVQTLILRTFNQEAESLELFPQVAYGILNQVGEISVAGEWDVIASLQVGITTFVDSTLNVNDTCKYAVVHKDLAYNYSAPVIIGYNSESGPAETEELSDKSLVYINFEDENLASWETEGSDANFNSSIVDGTNTRTGAKVLALYYSGATPEHYLLNKIDKIAVPSQQYFHIIAYAATSNIASGQTCPSGKLGSWIPTPQFSDFKQALSFERKTATHQNLEADSLNCSPLLISMAKGGACAVYYDDIVLYADTNAVADIVSPSMAENLAINKQTTGVVELSWTEGTDSLTGIKETLVLRTYSLTDENPTLYPQVAYSPLIEVGMVNNTGSWEVIASIPAGTTVYTDNALTANESCKYAIVHKDEVYNYSIPSIIENKADTGTGANSELVTSFKCYGVDGAIKISDASKASNVKVYNSIGVTVFTGQVNTSSLSIPLIKGLYIVNVSGEVTKVYVK